MQRFSHFAAPAVLGAALIVGVQGCASEHPDNIPARASIISEGRETAATSVPHDGTVYVYDESAHKILYSGKVAKGDDVRIDAKKNQVLLNEKVATERDLDSGHRYAIYFDRSDQSDAARRHEGATVIEPGSSGTTIVQPNNGGATVVQPGSGGSTVVIPPPQR